MARGTRGGDSWALEHWRDKAMAPAFRCLEARGIFLEQGLNLRLLPWQADFLLLSHWEALDPFFR